MVKKQRTDSYRKNVKALNDEQTRFSDAIDSKTVVFGVGPAGTGKTYLSIIKAIDALEKNQFDRIVVTRPAVEAGEQIGFLPGSADEKLDPYLKPIYDVFLERIGGEKLKKFRADGVIEIAPVGFMRGRTIKDAFIILDEAQNCTVQQLKMILTRIGEGSKMVINGDPNQSDLGSDSGLREVVSILRNCSPDLDVVELNKIVRSKIVGEILGAFENRKK
jgi:phosphate starvation-inducible PhoH-like protein